MMSEYDRIAGYYHNYLNFYADIEGIGKFILDVFYKNKISHDAKIIDIGCGSGEILAFLKKRGYSKLYGIDKSKSMVDLAKAELDGKARLFEIDFLNFKSKKTFDVVICSMDVINHINKDGIVKFFKKIRNILRKNGIFIFDINHSSYLRRLADKKVTKKHEKVIFKWNFRVRPYKVFIDFKIKEAQEVVCERIIQYIYSELFLEDLLKRNGFIVLYKMYDYKNVSKQRLFSKVCYVCKKTK